MYRQVKIFFLFFIMLVFFTNALSVAAANNKTIKVTVNFASVTTNGNPASIDNFDYSGEIYISAEEVCYFLEKKFHLNSNSKLVIITDKSSKSDAPLSGGKFTEIKKSTSKKIEVSVNKIDVKINGKLLKTNRLSYKGALFVQASDFCKLLNVKYANDSKKRIISISDKKPTKPFLNADKILPTNENIIVTIANWGSAKTREYRIGKGKWVIYSKPIVVKKNETIYARGKSSVGIESEIGSLTIENIDRTPPDKPILQADKFWATKENVIITIDKWSDSELKEFKIDDGEWQNYYESIVILTNAKIFARGTDSAGNISDEGCLTISNIDKTPPTEPKLTASSSAKTKGVVSISINYWGDAETKEYKFGGGPWQEYTVPISVTANGSIYARAKDALGNSSNVASIYINNIISKLSVEDIGKKSCSVVMIYVYNSANEMAASGSGFIISSDGEIVTNNHVIEKGTRYEVIFDDGKSYAVSKVLATNAVKDLAVVKIDTKEPLPYLELGNSDELVLGESVVAIGSPFRLKNTLAIGNVSGFRDAELRPGYTDIQISAPISSGSSGGALFNMYGEVVGITYATYLAGQNLNFAIPINDLKPMLDLA